MAAIPIAPVRPRHRGPSDRQVVCVGGIDYALRRFDELTPESLEAVRRIRAYIAHYSPMPEAHRRAGTVIAVYALLKVILCDPSPQVPFRHAHEIFDFWFERHRGELQ